MKDYADEDHELKPLLSNTENNVRGERYTEEINTHIAHAGTQ